MKKYYSKNWHIIVKRKGYGFGCTECRKRIIEGKEVWAKMGYGIEYICLDCWNRIEKEEMEMERQRTKEELIEEADNSSLEERLFDEENENFGYGE